ncbi:MAG: DinB family protein [Candidatus Sumerlaeaceae bacterium]|nr:DinB family protein [Candidatus Sumerlaeaceae bacterium]
MMTRAEFLKIYPLQALRTARVVRLFEDKDLGLKPGEGSMSTAEQIQHICQSHNFIRGLFEDKVVAMDLFQKPYDVSSVRAAVKSIGEARAEVVRAAKAASDDFLAEQIEPFGPEWKMSRLMLAEVMLDHECHHRGQLTVYARVAGKVPPMVYAPVDEKVLEI